MGKFSADFSNFTSPTTTPDTAVQLEYAAGEEGHVVELLMTGSGTSAAADTPHRASAEFCDATTAGTPGSTPTAEPMNQRSAASTATVDIEFTAEPTNINTVALVAFGFNQRGGMRWAVPQGEGITVSGDEAENTIVFRIVAQAAGAVDGHIHWWEP